MARSLTRVLLEYMADLTVKELETQIVYLQLAKLQGRPIPHYTYNFAEKQLDVTTASADYDERTRMTTDMLLTHIKDFYPEFLDEEKKE